MRMQEDSNALVALFCQPPLRRSHGLLEEEICDLEIFDFWVEPEYRFISVPSELGYCVLGSLFELSSQWSHDQDWN